MVDAEDRGGLVGRGDERARLLRALDAAEAGHGATFIVGGEAGIGKTRLMDVVAVDAAARGVSVLSGACLPTGRGVVPYAPFVEALRGLIGSVEPSRVPALLGPGRDELSRLLPGIGARSPAVADRLEFDQHGQGRLFEAILGVIERQAGASAVLLVIEDIHWADDGTRALLNFLVRTLRTSRALLLVTIRTDDLDRRDPVRAMVAELERDPWVQRLELRSLDRDDVAVLMRPALGDGATPEVIDDVMARTAGNPFFVEQLIATMRDGAASGVLPPGLRDVLVARLADLPDDTQAVMRAAAASGRRVDDDLLAAVLDLPHATIADALRLAIGQGILVDADGVDDGRGGYAFRHALLAEVAYGELLSGERDRLHEAFGRELERRGEIGGVPVTPAELAHHYVAARDLIRALPALVAAGTAAERVYAFADARRHFERALAILDEPTGDHGDAVDLAIDFDRIGLSQRAAECAVLTGAYARAIELGRAALAMAEAAETVDPVRLGSLLERLRWYLWEAGDRAAAEAAVEEALRLIPPTPPSPARARALAQAAGLRLFGGDARGAAPLAAEAIRVARAVGAGAEAEAALALGIQGWLEAVSGRVDDGIATFRAGLAIAERLGGVEGIALGHANLAALLDRVGQTEASLTAALEGYEITRRLGVARTYGGTLLGHATKALFDLGRWDEASAAADEGLGLDPVGRSAIWLHVNRARVDVNQGRFEAAATHLRTAAEIAGAHGGTESYGPARVTAVAELAAWKGDLAAVRAAVDEGLGYLHDDRPLDPALGWLAWHALRAEAEAALVARARHDDAAVAAIRARVDPIAARLMSGRVTVATTDARRAAIVGMCQGELSRLAGDRVTTTWEKTASAWDALGRPAPAAYARYRLAESILSARGDRSVAARALRAAHAAAMRLGAAPLLADITRLAGHARIDLTSGATPGAAKNGVVGSDDPGAALGLTQRETEVIRLVAAGWSNQQIADALFITRKTASVHVSNIMGKLGAQNRVEAAAIAHRLGLVDSRV